MDNRAYIQAFSPVDYSSGESIVSSSDSQNVDYGTEVDNTRHHYQKVSGSDNDSGDIAFNQTPENITSDFGNVHYPFGGLQVKKEKAIPVAIGKPRRGASYTAGFTTGVKSGSGKVGKTSVPRDAVQTGIQGTLKSQRENALNRFYSGQLG